MQKLLSFILLMLILAGCTTPEKMPALPADATVIILGDSLTYGTGANKGEDYPTLLATNTGWHIVNAGVPGDTSEQGLARLPTLLTEYQPAILMIELGGNDFLKNVAISETIANLKKIIQTAKINNISTLLIAIPDYKPMKAAFGGLEDHALYVTLAEEMGVPLVEDIFSSVLSKNSLKADYVHPNAKGYQQVEKNLRESLTEIGLFQPK